MVYEFRQLYTEHYAGVDPQPIGDALHTLQAARPGGTVTAADVVAAARDRQSPLHSLFTWDDAVAGARYREAQARMLLRAVQVRDDAHDASPAPRRVVVTTDREATAGPRRVWCPLDPDVQARQDLRAWRKRYQDVPPLGTVFDALEAHLAVLPEAERAREEYLAWRARCGAIPALAEAFEAIDAHLQALADEPLAS